jgi:hypothetical protein
MLLPLLLPQVATPCRGFLSPDLALRHGHSACLPSRASMKVERQSSTTDLASTSSITGMPPCIIEHVLLSRYLQSISKIIDAFWFRRGWQKAAAAVRRRRLRGCNAHPLPGELDHYSHRRCTGRAGD